MMRFVFMDFNLAWIARLLIVAVGSHLWSVPAIAKECQSTLPTELHTVGNLSFGGEARFWQYFVNQYDYEDLQRRDTAYTYWSGRGIAEYEFSETLYSGFEALLRNTEYDEEDFQCEHCSDGIRLDIREAWLEYAPSPATFHGGRDVYAFGHGMVIDNFFDHATMEFDIGNASVLAGGGVLANDVAREATSCQRGAVYEFYPYWKQTLDSDWGDHKLGFVETSFSLLSKQYQKLLLLYTDSAVDDDQNSWIADLYLNGRIAAGIKYFSEVALQYYSVSQNAYGGASLILSKQFSLPVVQPQIQAGVLIAQRDDEQRFAPVYESLRIGERYRYSLYEGDIVYLKGRFSFDAFKPLSVLPQYSRKFSGNTRDELDLGLELSFSDKYRFFITYSALNLDSEYEMTHQFQFHTRLIF